MDQTLAGRRILLMIAGGIAAYKALDLIRRLRERGAAVRCVMTRAAQEFVTPLAVASLSENKVYTDLFSLTDESEMGHIRLSREADLLVVAPATANLIARMAAGMADDLAALPWLVRLGRATLARIRQNIALALGSKALVLALAVFGLATLWMAILADVGVSLLVTANALRLLRRAG